MERVIICIIILFLGCCVNADAKEANFPGDFHFDASLKHYVELDTPIVGFEMPKIFSGKVNDGLDGCYTEWMQWFNDSLNCIGKVTYVPNIQGRSILVFSFKDNGSELTEELKRVIPRIQENAAKQYGKKDFSLQLNSTKTIWTNNYLIGDIAYSLVGYAWDNLEETDVISISLPLHACKYSGSSRTGTSMIKKRLRKEIFTDIVLLYDFKKISIPIDYRFNEIYSEMYKMFK